jgi:hypothetical protein
MRREKGVCRSSADFRRFIWNKVKLYLTGTCTVSGCTLPLLKDESRINVRYYNKELQGRQTGTGGLTLNIG